MKILKINDVLHCAARAQRVFQQPVRGCQRKFLNCSVPPETEEGAESQNLSVLRVGFDMLHQNFLYQASYLLIRPCEVLSRVANATILKVTNNALGVLLQHRHMSVRGLA